MRQTLNQLHYVRVSVRVIAEGGMGIVGLATYVSDLFASDGHHATKRWSAETTPRLAQNTGL